MLKARLSFSLVGTWSLVVILTPVITSLNSNARCIGNFVDSTWISLVYINCCFNAINTSCHRGTILVKVFKIINILCHTVRMPSCFINIPIRNCSICVNKCNAYMWTVLIWSRDVDSMGKMSRNAHEHLCHIFWEHFKEVFSPGYPHKHINHFPFL